MAKIKIGFKDISVPQQIERSRLIITQMTGNVRYTSPYPTLATISTAVNRLETAYNKSRGRDKDEVAIMKLRRKELLPLISQLAAYVQNVSGGDKEMILSSGFDLVNHRNIVAPVSRVYNVRTRKEGATGTLKLWWNKVKGAKVYLVRVMLNLNEPEKAEIKGTPSGSRCEIKGLISGTRYYIEVAAVGGGIIGPWSDAVNVIAT